MRSPTRHLSRSFRDFRGLWNFRGGFTLIELMIVISIIGVLIAVSIPALGILGKDTRSSAAINAVAVGVEMARYYATREVADADTPIGIHYSGAAAIIHPAGEIRLVEHDQSLRESTGNPPPLLWPRRGYKDVDGSEYLKLPKRVAVLGISRRGPNEEHLQLFPPPSR